MSFALMIHKLSLVLTVAFGIVYIFKKSPLVRGSHYASAIIFVVSILYHLFADAFSAIGYVFYALLLVATFFSPKFLPERGRLFGHIALFFVSVVWLIVIHIV